MARYTEHDRTEIDAVAEQWRDSCLIGDGSLLLEQSDEWTLTVAQELVACFVEDQLEDERSFEPPSTRRSGRARRACARV